MKKLYTLLFIVFISSSLFAQSPPKMSYQAVIRNSSDQLVINHAVGMKISILKDATPVYVETQTPTTNSNGLVSIEIGGGTPVTGTFANIDWSTGTYFIKTELDPSGGTSYSITGTSQILSVPYALYAKTSEKVSIPNQTSGDMLFFDGINWTRLPKGSSGQVLAMNPTGQLKWVSLFNVPIATADGYDNSSLSDVELFGTVYPNLLQTSVKFEYGESTSYGTEIIANESPISGYEKSSVHATIPLVTINTTYHFRVIAENDFGVSYSNDKTFIISCMVCKSVTYDENDVVVNEGTPAEYCGADLLAVLATPPITVGNLTIKKECSNK